MLPLPLAVRRIGYRFGVTDPVVPVRGAPKAQPMNDESFARLRAIFPVVPSSAIIEPMSPEDFRKLHG